MALFQKWLRCYYQPEMKNLVDHNGRTIWFSGPTGPLVPKSKPAEVWSVPAISCDCYSAQGNNGTGVGVSIG